MILREIKLTNFGIHGGEIEFDLSPLTTEHFNRPIILFRGQNGVGKSTLVEAIRLCLHGPLALGNRVSQREYEIYLGNRLYHGSNATEAANHAVIRLAFDYITVGRRQTYIVERTWERRGESIASDLSLWQNEELIDATFDDKEYFLRELVPPGVADLFFFDGEKIETLAEIGDASDLLLADTVKNLLGLHLIEQLDRDLDVYLTRQSNVRDLHSKQLEFETLSKEEGELRRQRDEIRSQLTHCRQGLTRLRKAIDAQEQKIMVEGGNFAQQEQARQIERQQIEAALVVQEQAIQELCRELVPFIVAPRLLTAVRDRLQREAAYERWAATQVILDDLTDKISEESSTYAFWVGVTEVPDEIGQQTHLLRLWKIFEPYAVAPMDETEVIHRVSDEVRNRLLDWIDEALTETPRQLVSAIYRLNGLREQLKVIDTALGRVPHQQTLKPLQDQLRQMERDLGRLEAEYERLLAEDRRLEYLLERNAFSRQRITEHIAQIETDDGRLQLAARTKLLLSEYQERLAQRKLQQLQVQLVKRFNQLCRKRNFIERVSIDPIHFGVTLYRGSQPFPRRQLSAGEQQLFAIATLWALREVSGRPLPVIIDTPLSRLDKEHRQSMIEAFFPQVSHQVIVLATDVEINDEDFAYLQPAIARAYLLREAADTGGTQATEETVNARPALIRIEEVAVHA